LASEDGGYLIILLGWLHFVQMVVIIIVHVL
jgi:hypothetical protein